MTNEFRAYEVVEVPRILRWRARCHTNTGIYESVVQFVSERGARDFIKRDCLSIAEGIRTPAKPNIWVKCDA